MIVYQEIEGLPEDAIIGKIMELKLAIFGDSGPEKFLRRLQPQKMILSILAFEENRLTGFKTGYALDEEIFYSWIGGIEESYRKSGIASELMARQHGWCIRNGFLKVRTKTMNQFKPMMIFNLRRGFDIVGADRDLDGALKVIMEKHLI